MKTSWFTQTTNDNLYPEFHLKQKTWWTIYHFVIYSHSCFSIISDFHPYKFEFLLFHKFLFISFISSLESRKCGVWRKSGSILQEEMGEDMQEWVGFQRWCQSYLSSTWLWRGFGGIYWVRHKGWGNTFCNVRCLLHRRGVRTCIMRSLWWKVKYSISMSIGWRRFSSVVSTK